MADFPFIPIIVMGIVAGLDTTAAFQIMVSQPIVACPLLGWMMGDPVMGWMVGITTQLLWMGKLPVGAATFPDGNMGSLVAAGLAVQFRKWLTLDDIGVLLALSVLLGTAVAWVGGWIIVAQRKIQTRWVKWFEKQANIGNLRKYSRGYWLIVVWNGFIGGCTALLFFILGQLILRLIIPLLPVGVYRIGYMVMYLLLGIGLTQILILHGLRRWWLILGGGVGGILLWRIF
jgi:PTS system mannose-specific IIC component